MAITPTQDADMAVLRDLNRGYVRAVQESNVAWFEKHLAEDFLNTNPDCTLIDRAGFLVQIVKTPGISGLREEDVNIRLLGELALIHAKTRYVRNDGQNGSGRYTDIWMRREGRWVCVAAHVNRG